MQRTPQRLRERPLTLRAKITVHLNTSSRISTMINANPTIAESSKSRLPPLRFCMNKLTATRCPGHGRRRRLPRILVNDMNNCNHFGSPLRSPAAPFRGPSDSAVGEDGVFEVKVPHLDSAPFGGEAAALCQGAALVAAAAEGLARAVMVDGYDFEGLVVGEVHKRDYISDI